ncbi:right-handed parallel beta-helix repeat-containing protein [Streptomyces sp. NPDC054834]
MLTVKKTRALVLAALLSTSVSGIATSAAAASPQAPGAVVPCGDVDELIRQINRANARGTGTIALSSRCEYKLTVPAVPTGPHGADGLPVITGNLTIVADTGTATVTRATATPFRIAEVAPQGSLTLKGITLSNGSATSEPGSVGGGILTRGTLSLAASRITGNTASVTGGGIEVASSGTARLTSSAVTQNTASDGGGIHVDTSGRLTVNSGSIYGNTATFTGGGLATNGTTVLNGTFVRGNTTDTFEGGGIFTAIGPLTVNSGDISGNTAASHGGGIANFGSAVRLLSTSVVGNTAELDGGGLYNQAGTSYFLAGKVTANRAAGQGGGIFRAGGSVTLVRTPVNGNAPDNCAPTGAVTGCTR